MKTLLAILGAIAVAVTLVQNGVLTTAQAAGLLVAIVIGLAITNKFMRFALPIFAFALFVTYNYHGIPGELRALLSGILALTIVLCGLYIIVRGAIGRTRNRRSDDD